MFFTPEYQWLPNKAYWHELFRPWKLFSLACGLGWLIYGALNYDIGDWDIGVSVIMAVLTYLLTPWSMFLLVNAIRYR